ncbi:SCO family protein [Dokdonia sp. Hel_I_53]|uniref:SCO family protein n=1 Tax=Dokdonia sp. Hel_I_53 TaxID=1566287 RepID=UPI00119C0306|nr:SCO family protein [Dokdonia sp. Hel_I_53]TVZ52871.1 protein SCO1/2 [Dokdonia sp. Hel_I_53]
MSSIVKRYKVLIITMIVLSSIILTLIYSQLKTTPQLPIYQPEMVEKSLVDTTLQDVKKYHRIADFELTNQNNKIITQDFYKDKIYVADFFFTTCQDICPIMTEHMVEIQNKLKDDPSVLLLSHTVIPEYDTPEILKAYAVEKGVDDTKWNLVTGPREQIYTLARKSYLAVKDIPGEENEMVHTENFMLIDKKKQIRGYYDGTSSESIEQLLEDIEILKESYEPAKKWWEKLF